MSGFMKMGLKNWTQTLISMNFRPSLGPVNGQKVEKGG